MKQKNKFACSYSIQEAGQRILILVIFAAVLVGCMRSFYEQSPVSNNKKINNVTENDTGRFKTALVADQIDSHYRGTANGPIGVTTLVDLDDLYRSSTFGRIFAEEIMSELTARGFDVVELRHADALSFLENTGEFALSRNTTSVRRQRDLAGIVVGTYVASPVRVYVNMRMIDPSSSIVLSAGSVELDKTAELDRLLRGNSLPSSLERIPVKHLGLKAYPLAAFQNSAESSYDNEENSWYAPPPAPPHRGFAEPQLFSPPTAKHSGEKDSGSEDSSTESHKTAADSALKALEKVKEEEAPVPHDAH